MNKFFSLLFLFIFLFLFSATNNFILGSPHPGVGSSALMKLEEGLLFIRYGFKVKVSSSIWQMSEEKNESSSASININTNRNANENVSVSEKMNANEKMSENSSNSIRLQNLTKSKAQLTLSKISLIKEMSLETYAKKWMKDYSSYGFDLLGSKTFYQNNQKGLVVDLIHKNKKNQIRQVIFGKNNNFLVFTCLDEPKSFQKTLKDCNEVVKTFSWLQ